MKNSYWPEQTNKTVSKHLSHPTDVPSVIPLPLSAPHILLSVRLTLKAIFKWTETAVDLTSCAVRKKKTTQPNLLNTLQ